MSEQSDSATSGAFTTRVIHPAAGTPLPVSDSGLVISIPAAASQCCSPIALVVDSLRALASRFSGKREAGSGKRPVAFASISLLVVFAACSGDKKATPTPTRPSEQE